MRAITAFALITSILSLGVAIFLLVRPASRHAFVKTEVLFNDFKMTKELKSKFQNTENIRKNILDSLLLDLRMRASAKELSKEKIEVLRQNYLQKRELFDGQNQELTKNYDEQVWTRINLYMKEYCQQNKYSYILGTGGGDVTVLYAADDEDITGDVLKYMNGKYEGNLK